MKIFLSLLLSALAFSHLQAQTYCFDGSDKKAISVSSSDIPLTVDMALTFRMSLTKHVGSRMTHSAFPMASFISLSMCLTATTGSL